MRLTAIINLPVVVLALVIGAAATPFGSTYKMVKGGPSTFISVFFFWFKNPLRPF